VGTRTSGLGAALQKRVAAAIERVTFIGSACDYAQECRVLQKNAQFHSLSHDHRNP
jgi:hypothetical protein